MNVEKKPALGKGLSALIPDATATLDQPRASSDRHRSTGGQSLSAAHAATTRASPNWRSRSPPTASSSPSSSAGSRPRPASRGRATRSSPASAAGGPPSAPACCVCRWSSRTSPSRTIGDSSRWPSSRTSSARTSTRSRKPPPTSGSSTSSRSARRTSPAASARTGRRWRTCSACSSCRPRSRATSPTARSRWVTPGPSSACPPTPTSAGWPRGHHARPVGPRDGSARQARGRPRAAPRHPGPEEGRPHQGRRGATAPRAGRARHHPSPPAWRHDRDRVLDRRRTPAPVRIPDRAPLTSASLRRRPRLPRSADELLRKEAADRDGQLRRLSQ